MGSAFTFTAVHENPELAWESIVAGMEECSRIEALISSWTDDSETSEVNRNAGIQAVKVSKELFDLVFRCLKVSDLSNGYFDISFASIEKVWKFDGSMTELPDEESLKASVAKINYKNIELDAVNQSIFLREKGMRIGFGAIGKGYAADRAKKIMKAKGALSGVVNAGGDLKAWGKRPDGENWSIGITDPIDKTKIKSYLNISDRAVVTSGNYERFAEIDGKRYCHIIDPKTGWPVEGLQSVTVICSDGELADALATTVFVLGESDGLRLINHLEGVECIIVNNKNKMIYSNNVELNLVSTGE